MSGFIQRTRSTPDSDDGGAICRESYAQCAAYAAAAARDNDNLIVENRP
jgi:hypothetical protein